MKILTERSKTQIFLLLHDEEMIMKVSFFFWKNTAFSGCCRSRKKRGKNPNCDHPEKKKSVCRFLIDSPTHQHPELRKKQEGASSSMGKRKRRESLFTQ